MVLQVHKVSVAAPNEPAVLRNVLATLDRHGLDSVHTAVAHEPESVEAVFYTHSRSGNGFATAQLASLQDDVAGCCAAQAAAECVDDGPHEPPDSLVAGQRPFNTHAVPHLCQEAVPNRSLAAVRCPPCHFVRGDCGALPLPSPVPCP